MLFRPKNRIIDFLGLSLWLGSVKIELVPEFKSLGVYFNEHLSWNKHVDTTIIKIAKVVGILSRLRYCLPQSVKKIIFQSLFSSVIGYCFLVWGTTTFSNVSKLHRLQKRALRIIVNVSRDAPTEAIFCKLNIIPIPQQYEQTLLRRYRTTAINTAIFFKELYRLERKSHNYSTRTKNHFVIPETRTNYGRQSISYTLPLLLNTIQ